MRRGEGDWREDGEGRRVEDGVRRVEGGGWRDECGG